MGRNSRDGRASGDGQRTQAEGSAKGSNPISKILVKAQVAGVSPSVLKAALLIAVVILVAVAFRWWSAASDSGFQINGGEQVSDAAGTEDSDASGEAEEYVEMIAVHVVGAVGSPGVYMVEKGSRVQDAVMAAGGFSDDACTDAVNLAREAVDGEQILIPTNEEVQSGTYVSSSSYQSASGQATQLVNINTATEEQLDELPGVGPSTAQKIIAYREANGGFSSIEEIKEVSGIGDSRYEQIKDLITV